MELQLAHSRQLEEKLQVLNSVEVFKTWSRNELSRLAEDMQHKKVLSVF